MDTQEFLLARIAEDEAVVARMGAYPHASHSSDIAGTFSPACFDCTGMGSAPRVLRECAAKREIVGMHRNNPSPYGDQYCATCSEVGQDGKDFPCETVKALAAVYSDHPDYQQAWSL